MNQIKIVSPFLFILSIFLFWFNPLYSSAAESKARKSNGNFAAVTSYSPSTGVPGDIVTFVGWELGKSIAVEFSGTSGTPVSAEVTKRQKITHLNGEQLHGSLKWELFQVTVPEGVKSGSIKVVTDGAVLIPGEFTIIKKIKTDIVDNPEPPLHGAPINGRPPASNIPGSGPVVSQPKPHIFDKYADLPCDPSFVIVEPKAPESPKTPPPEIVPSFYGKDIHSENATIFYVIDVSGSMDETTGQYVKEDGTTAIGSKLDRAKVQLILSIISLPKNFEFNMLGFDCSLYPWEYKMQQASEENKKKAIGWIRNLRAGGGTGTGPAVTYVLITYSQVKSIVLLTDGNPNCGSGDESGSWYCALSHESQIRSCNKGCKIDVFGINTYGQFRQFCVDVASQNGGTFTEIR